MSEVREIVQLGADVLRIHAQRVQDIYASDIQRLKTRVNHQSRFHFWRIRITYRWP
jgi:hypothetical protein